jgi:tRNA A-37 threonylcarbamoyl transferase component Bud32
MQNNKIDDFVKNRSLNINLNNFFVKPDTIHFFKARAGNQYYARNTCFHNDEFTIDERLESYNGSGSSGVVRDGEYISSNGTIKSGSIKVFISNKINIRRDLLELKIGIEANRLVHNSVAEIEFVNKCDLLTSDIIPDEISSTNEIMIIGMEKGLNDVRVELNKHTNNIKKFNSIISKAAKACDMFNKYGFFHRDIKLENMIMVNRNGIRYPVLIDFGHTTYMDAIHNLINGKIVYVDLSDFNQNPPLDAFYLCLDIYSRYYKYHNLRSIIFELTYKYYIIIRKLGLDDDIIKNINKNTFDNYNLGSSMILFLNGIPIADRNKIYINDLNRLTPQMFSKINSYKIIDSSFRGIQNSLLVPRTRSPSPTSRRSPSPTSRRSPSPTSRRSPSPISRRSASNRKSASDYSTPLSANLFKSSKLPKFPSNFKLQSIYSTPLSANLFKSSKLQGGRTLSINSKKIPKLPSNFKLQSIYSTPPSAKLITR